MTEISCDGKNVLYEFRIEDSGIGMSREYMERIVPAVTQEKAMQERSIKEPDLECRLLKV